MVSQLLVDAVPKGATRRRKCAFYKGQLCWIRSVLQRFMYENKDSAANPILEGICQDISWFLQLDIKEENTDFYPNLKGIMTNEINEE